MGVADSIGKWFGDTFGGAYHAITGTSNEKEKRAQAALVKEQIDAYKAQTEILKKDVETKREQLAAEKKRVDEKQIRQLRNRYRSNSGLIRNRGEAPRAQLTQASGGGLPNQLGA